MEQPEAQYLFNIFIVLLPSFIPKRDSWEIEPIRTIKGLEEFLPFNLYIFSTAFGERAEPTTP